MSQRSVVRPSRMRDVYPSKQPRRILFALLLLLVALAIVLVKDRDFWFGTDEASIESDMPTQAQQPVANAPHQTARVAPVAPKKRTPAAKHVAEPNSSESTIVATNRTAVAPLNVEVVAGNKHNAAHPGSSAAKVEITKPASVGDEKLAPATNAAEREAVPAPPMQAPQQSFEANYPALAQHMNVQGSVVLQALIGVDGIIEQIRVLSGPAILTTAAEQAVRQWHFKPFLQNGQPVETKAKITVNFSIKVGDSGEKTTLAESRADGLLIFTR